MWQVQRRILLLFILFLGSLFVFRLWEKSVIFSVPCNVGSLLCQPKYNMAPSQWLLPKGSILVAHTGCFPKRKSTSMYKPCLCCIPWHACKFQLTFNQYFQIILISVFSQFSHFLTIRSVQMLGWSWYVCRLDVNYGLYSIFPVRKKEEIDRKTCSSFFDLSLGWDEVISWVKNKWTKFNLRNKEMKRISLESSHWWWNPPCFRCKITIC